MKADRTSLLVQTLRRLSNELMHYSQMAWTKYENDLSTDGWWGHRQILKKGFETNNSEQLCRMCRMSTQRNKKGGKRPTFQSYGMFDGSKTCKISLSTPSLETEYEAQFLRWSTLPNDSMPGDWTAVAELRSAIGRELFSETPVYFLFFYVRFQHFRVVQNAGMVLEFQHGLDTETGYFR